MANETYSVEAGFNFRAPAAIRGLSSISSRISALGRSISGTRNAASGLVTRLVAVGAAYIGIRSATNAMRGLARSVFDVSSDAESMQTNLAAVLSGMEKISFSKAVTQSSQLFKVIEDMAVQSPSTGAELFQVFQGIVGPIRNAGVGMKDILTLTQNSVATATALGVDFQQASRDISIMARGLAGADVKTFSLLQSMGLIKETTEEWNQLNPSKRAQRLMDVMGQMGGQAASAYAKTWVGLSSTFRGIMDRFRRVFGTALFERLKATLERVNNFLLKYRTNIEAVLTVLGTKVAAIMNNASMRLEASFTGGSDAMGAVADRIDGVIARMQDLWAKFQELKPALIAAAKVFIAIQAAQIVLGPLLTAVGAIGGAVASIGGLLSTATAAAATGGAAAAGGVGLAAGGPGAAALLAGVTGAGTAATTAAGGGIMAALVPILAPLAAIGAAVAAVVLAFKVYGEGLKNLMAPLMDSLRSIGGQLVDIGGALWAFLRPILAALGGAVIATLILAFRALAWVADKVVLPPLKILAKILGWVGEEVLVPVFSALATAFSALYGAIVKVVEFVNSALEKSAGAGFFGAAGTVFAQGKKAERQAKAEEAARSAAAAAGAAGLARRPTGPAKNLFEELRAIWRSADMLQGATASGDIPGARGGVTNDFRGSKIEVKQEFREADPDRVFVQMRDALEREAVSRTQSGFASAFSR